MDRLRFCRTLTLLSLLAVPLGCGGSGQNGAPPDGGNTVTTAGSFQLAWQDDFNAFDGTRWQLMTHTWDGNLAQFSTENTSFANGIAWIHVYRWVPNTP